MGFLVRAPGLAQPGQNTTFHLIDGQQRLTTLSLLLAAIRNVAREEGQEELADEIDQYDLVHPLKKGDQHYRVIPERPSPTAISQSSAGKARPLDAWQKRWGTLKQAFSSWIEQCRQIARSV